jgi:lysophospholipase L1-like esterase
MGRFVVLTALMLALGTAACAADEFLLRDGERVLFLGDSISNAGTYIQYIDAYMVTRFPQKRFELINLGLSSETVSGLSEPDHPFPRPGVHERLERALELTKPGTVVACYGMNDGIYAPFDESRFAAYRHGIEKLIDAVTRREARLVLVTPPPFDPLPIKTKLVPRGAPNYGWLTPYEGYDETLARYAAWLLGIRSRGQIVVDSHEAISRYLSAVRRDDPRYTLAGDGIHPNATGQWLIARELLNAWKSPEEVDRAVLDARTLNPLEGQVSDVARDQGSGRFTFTWLTRIPIPSDPAWDKRLVEQGLGSSGFNQHTLKVVGLSARKYVLQESDTRLGEVSADSLARGIDLLVYPDLSTNRRAQALWTLVAERERLFSPVWLERVGHKRPGTPKGLPFDEARKQAAALDEKIRALVQPVALRLRLIPVVEP